MACEGKKGSPAGTSGEGNNCFGVKGSWPLQPTPSRSDTRTMPTQYEGGYMCRQNAAGRGCLGGEANTGYRIKKEESLELKDSARNPAPSFAKRSWPQRKEVIQLDAGARKEVAGTFTLGEVGDQLLIKRLMK